MIFLLFIQEFKKNNLDNGNILSFKFYFDHYSIENLFLYDNKFKYAFFDNCKINGKNKMN